MDYVWVALITIVFVLLLDVVWLTINKPRYNMLVRGVQGSDLGNVRLWSAVVTYVLVVGGVFIFSIPLIRLHMKNKKESRFIDILRLCVLYGGGLGLVIYGVFNFTNLSIFKGYNLGVAVMDTLWGMFLYTAACIVFFSIMRLEA